MNDKWGRVVAVLKPEYSGLNEKQINVAKQFLAYMQEMGNRNVKNSRDITDASLCSVLYMLLAIDYMTSEENKQLYAWFNDTFDKACLKEVQ